MMHNQSIYMIVLGGIIGAYFAGINGLLIGAIIGFVVGAILPWKL